MVLGNCYRATEQIEDAKACYQEVLKVYPDNEQVQTILKALE